MVRRARLPRRLAIVLCHALPALAAPLAAQEPAAAGSREPGPHVRWKYAPEGAQFEDLVAAEGVVFVLDRAGKIHALVAATGEVKWKTKDKLELQMGFGLALSPDPEFPALLVGSDSGILALDVGTGAVLWHTETPLGVAGPACSNGVVAAGGADGKVYGCALRTGEILWQLDYLEDRPADPPGFAGEGARFGGRPARPSAAAAADHLIALSVFDQSRTLAIDARNGKRLWSFPTKGWMFGRPAIDARNVYVGSQDDHFYAVDRELGKLAWEVETGARIEGAAAVAGRFLYFGSCDAYLYAVDNGVGKVAWRFATEHEEGQGAPIYSRPLVRGDTVYLAAMRGAVYAVDRRTGELRWQLTPVPNSEPNSDLVEAGGLLFVSTRRSDRGGEAAVVAIAER